MTVVRERALARAAESPRPAGAVGVALTPLDVEVDGDSLRYEWVTVTIDRDLGAAHLTVRAPSGPATTTPDELLAAGADAWVIAAARQLDDAMLRLRFNEPEVGTWVLHTAGDAAAVVAVDDLLGDHADHWLVNEIRLYWTRTLKRLDLSARTLVALVEPGSCFAGVLAELALAADRSFMLDGPDPDGSSRRRAPPDRGQRRLVPDVQRPQPAGDPVLGPRRRPRGRARAGSARTCWPPRRPSSAW